MFLYPLKKTYKLWDLFDILSNERLMDYILLKYEIQVY